MKSRQTISTPPSKGKQTPIGTHFNEDPKRRVGKKLSVDLSSRTHLTKEQLVRAKGQAGDGLSSRYGSDGTQSLALTRKLAKAAKKARRFILFSEQLGKTVYVSKAKELFPLTFDIKEARTFIEGFDDPRAKVSYWNLTIPSIDFMTKKL